MNVTQAKQIKIADYLNGEGVRPTKIRGADFWYSSPLREEKEPSFKVNDRANVWYDYGLGQGGNILDLVMAMHRLDNVSQALSKLSGTTPSRPAEIFSVQQQKASSGLSGIAITKITPIANPALIEYIKSRKIDVEIAKRYCRDVYYTANGKNYFSVGFRNDGGGYELSNPYFKGSTSPKGITTFGNNSGICSVFEGFWDFLSYLTMQKVELSQHSITVLNSVTNVQKAMDFLKTHNEIYMYTDNDDAGRRTSQLIKSACPFASDMSPRYAEYKDLNDFLRGIKMGQSQPKTAKIEQPPPKKRGMKM